MNAPTVNLRAHRPVVIQRPYERETFARMSYWMDGALVCGCCDCPIYDARCDGCEIVFTGEQPAEPVTSYSEARQAYHDSSVYLSEVRQARHFGRSGYGA